MDFFDKLDKSKGGYIFLSHSHADIEKVRILRNALEEKGFEPLCFYLKCLNDDSEIEDLIKREIDAREWFVFANSENSRKSRWVTLEREYISRTDKKKIIPIDINDENSILKATEKIIRNLRLFISASSHDKPLVCKIKNRLQAKDYQVFFGADSIPAGSNYSQVVFNALVEASHDGGVLALITESATKSEWIMRELELAASEKGNIIPVMVGDAKLSPAMEFLLRTYQLYHLSEQPTDDEIDEMIDRIGNAIVNN